MHVLTHSSPYTRLQSLPLGAVRLRNGFWFHRQDTNRRITLQHGFCQLERAGNFHNLRLAAKLAQGSYRGACFMDSDLYKWLEAVIYEGVNSPDAGLDGMVEETIRLIAAAQQDDGYLNSYFQVVAPDKRWTDLDFGHEMYCAGHLIQAAVAHHRATGRDDLLDVACKFADHIGAVFGPNGRDGACGHPEIEMALVELYRETREARYLDLAGLFIDRRGQGKMTGSGRFEPAYFQDRVPVRHARQVEGHAVRQLYLDCGAADLFLETGEPALMGALERQWRNMTAHKMYLTGGYGSRFEGESFGEAYELPSDRAYGETCAAIAAMMWNWRMLLGSGSACFAESLERSLYNAFLAGVSLDGRRFFYVNPLQSRAGSERQAWFPCACCPPNLMRQIGALGHYVATQNAGGVQIHQYISSGIAVSRPDGASLALRLETGYPWEGWARFTVDQTGREPWTLALRIPSWADGTMLRVNGAASDSSIPCGSYIEITRTWQVGDQVDLDIPIACRLTEPNPRVDALRGTLAIERGPLVYCLEQADQPDDVDLLDIRIEIPGALQDQWREGLLGGIVAVEAQGAVIDAGQWGDRLYRPLSREVSGTTSLTLTAIPYFAWANRGQGGMRVWLPTV